MLCTCTSHCTVGLFCASPLLRLSLHMEAKVFPGQDLGASANYASGPGTVIFQDRIRSTLIGIQHVTEASGAKPSLSVVRAESIMDGTLNGVKANSNLLPEVGSTVLARITRISRLQANAQILVLGETALVEDFLGIIRIADIRATEKDKVKVYSSFRPGDIVRAEVISLGDQSSYFLSTARNELGVLFAWNEVGEMMYPSSWKEMRTDGGSLEERKVAKPFL